MPDDIILPPVAIYDEIAPDPPEEELVFGRGGPQEEALAARPDEEDLEPIDEAAFAEKWADNPRMDPENMDRILKGIKRENAVRAKKKADKNA